jgi:transcriptional regulator GlxA family with amidase domain
MGNNMDIFAANSDSATAGTAKRIAMIAFDGVEILDVTGPASVFSKGNVMVPGTYEFIVLGPRDGFVHSNSAMTIPLHACWKSIRPDTIDTLIVAGGHEDIVLHELLNGELSEWIKSVAKHARRMASVCTGAFALGQAGLLKGRCATTHWSACKLLQGHFPDTRVEDDKIYVRDGDVWTSAGILTGIDLALALVEDDLGRSHALKIGELLVLTGMRPGDSPQKSPLLNSQAQVSNPIGDLLSWIQLNLTEDLRVESLAKRMGLSERHLARIFRHETGVTPSRYVSAIRLDYAAVLLRSTTWKIESVATKSGFDSVDALERSFLRRWGMPPGAYRKVHELK